MSQTAKTRFVRVQKVQKERLEWLWPGRVPLGKLTLIVGDPGLGKSLVTVDMAARVTRGTGWADLPHDQGTLGSVLLINSEDGLADTLRPRLEAAGANLDHVTAMDITAEGEHMGIFALDRDLPALEQTIDELGDCRLVVIDPISLSLGRSFENANVAVRTLLAPLIALATAKHVAVVAVTHLNKSMTQRVLYRSMGSMAFVSAARSAWLVMADPADRSRRLLLNMKSNLSGERTGLAYRIEDCEGQAARVVWEPGEVTETPDELLARVAIKEAADESIVAEWLQGRLDTTPTSADSILRAADNLGFSTNQVFKASQKLGVQKVKLGYCMGWEWSLPRENKTKA